MALTYEQSADLMKDPAFVNRVKVACLHYADYIFGEATSVPAHNTRLRWAQTVTTSPDTVAQTIAPPVVMDAKVQEQGSAITDADLQSSVETTVNKLL
jgi:predicted Zn-dependent protease